MFAKRIKTPDGEFQSVRSAADFYGVTESGMSRRISRHPETYQILERLPYVTPAGRFATVQAVASAYGIGYTTAYYRLHVGKWKGWEVVECGS